MDDKTDKDNNGQRHSSENKIDLLSILEFLEPILSISNSILTSSFFFCVIYTFDSRRQGWQEWDLRSTLQVLEIKSTYAAPTSFSELIVLVRYLILTSSFIFRHI